MLEVLGANDVELNLGSASCGRVNPVTRGYLQASGGIAPSVPAWASSYTVRRWVSQKIVR
jgi:hypothetical protein